MHFFSLLSLLVSLAALFGFVSYRVLRMPTTVGTTLLALGLSVVMLVAREAGAPVTPFSEVVRAIPFHRFVLHGMLAFLLFAGALHLNIRQLARERLPVAALSVVGTVLSTAMIAGILHVVLLALHLPARWIFCLLFGSLISPTDPIAVLEMLARVNAPASLETRLAGESLFNDGVGAVLFLALLGAAAGGNLPSPVDFGGLLLLEAGGGIALGLATGYIVYRLLRLVDSYRTEVTMTLALAMGTYAVADGLHISAPLSVIAAGLVVNGFGRRDAMSERTIRNMETFWDLVDEILNLVLFLLIGLELMVIRLERQYLVAGAIAIPAVLLARWFSVSSVMVPLGWCRKNELRHIGVLTWGGLRGGLAVALALGLPDGQEHDLALTMTYMVVIFSIVVQGLTVGKVLRRSLAPEDIQAVPAATP